MKKDIDFSKIVNEDDVVDIEDNIKGVIVLLDGLVEAEQRGSHKFQEHSYKALQTVLDNSLNQLNNIKMGIDYMDSKIRENI